MNEHRPSFRRSGPGGSARSSRGAGTRLWLLVLLGLLATGWVQALTLDELAARLGAHPVVRGPFVQEKHLRGLAQPLVSRGEFVLARDQGLLWRITSPLTLLYRIDASGIAQRTATGWQRQPGQDAAGQQSRLFLALLAGDQRGLERNFELALSGTGESWQLTLTPRSRLLQQIFQTIEVSGGNTVEAITLHETQGDRTLVRLPASVVDSSLTDAERDRLAP